MNTTLTIDEQQVKDLTYIEVQAREISRLAEMARLHFDVRDKLIQDIRDAFNVLEGLMI